MLSLRLEKNFKIGEYLAKLQARTWLSHELCVLGQNTAKRRKKCTKQSRSWLLLCQIFTNLKKIHSQTQHKHFLIWLLRTPPHLKYVATLPCSLSLMACFADINVWQGSVATCAGCDGIFDNCKFTKESSGEKFL